MTHTESNKLVKDALFELEPVINEMGDCAKAAQIAYEALSEDFYRLIRERAPEYERRLSGIVYMVGKAVERMQDVDEVWQETFDKHVHGRAEDAA